MINRHWLIFDAGNAGVYQGLYHNRHTHRKKSSRARAPWARAHHGLKRNYSWGFDVKSHAFGVGVGSQSALNGNSKGVAEAMTSVRTYPLVRAVAFLQYGNRSSLWIP